jgi:hypothetical protein
VSGGTIEIADLVVRYDAVPAVNGVSFTVAQGVSTAAVWVFIGIPRSQGRRAGR